MQTKIRHLCRGFALALAVFFILLLSTPDKALGASQNVALSPGWNIVSTSRLLESHSFSVAETSANFDIYALDPLRASGWATMADLGQTEFMPLYGYFVNNKTSGQQTLTFNYRTNVTPSERLFERKFTVPGWYSVGIANPTYAKKQGEVSSGDSNNPG